MCFMLFLVVNVLLYYILFFSEFYYYIFNGKVFGLVIVGFIEFVFIKYFYMDFIGFIGV